MLPDIRRFRSRHPRQSRFPRQQPTPNWNGKFDCCVLTSLVNRRFEKVILHWSEKKIQKENLSFFKAVEILGMEMCTDTKSTFDSGSAMNLVGYDMTRNAISRLVGATGVPVAQVDVIELHDCFSANELITYEALGLCPEGKVRLPYNSNQRSILARAAGWGREGSRYLFERGQKLLFLTVCTL